MISSTVGMLYRYVLHRRAHLLLLFLLPSAISFMQSCAPSLPQFSQSGAQRLRFTVASRSFARAASAPRPRHTAYPISSLSRTSTRARSEILLALARFSSIHSIQMLACSNERYVTRFTFTRWKKAFEARGSASVNS